LSEGALVSVAGLKVPNFQLEIQNLKVKIKKDCLELSNLQNFQIDFTQGSQGGKGGNSKLKSKNSKGFSRIIKSSKFSNRFHARLARGQRWKFKIEK
jgi:hypothetical protein